MKHCQPLIFSALLLLANGAYSGVYNWNTTTGDWDTSTANWTGAGTVWVDGNDAVFSNTATASVITLPGTISANSLMFGNGTNNGNFTLSGGTLNTSPNRRRAMHSYFCRRQQKQQLDQRKYVRAETLARLSDAAKFVLDVA